MIIGFTVPEIWHVTNVIIFHFGQSFALLPPNSPKNKNFKKMKKTPGDIIILHKCTKNYDYRLYYSWDTAHDECNCYFSFRAIFCQFTPLTAQKSKISKNKKKTKNKKTWRYHPVTWHIEVGVPPKKWVEKLEDQSLWDLPLLKRETDENTGSWWQVQYSCYKRTESINLLKKRENYSY